MKWETIKKHVADGVYGSIVGNPNFSGMNRVNIGDQMLVAIESILDGTIHKYREASGSANIQYSVAKALAEEAHHRVMDWDIRRVGVLRDLFPQHFPKTLLKKQLVCYMADNKDSDWVVEPHQGD